jgi:hypothetical protein
MIFCLTLNIVFNGKLSGRKMYYTNLSKFLVYLNLLQFVITDTAYNISNIYTHFYVLIPSRYILGYYLPSIIFFFKCF